LYYEELQLWQILEDSQRGKHQQPAPKQTITSTGKRNLCIDGGESEIGRNKKKNGPPFAVLLTFDTIQKPESVWMQYIEQCR
jgi:hypothetical protein